LPQTWIHYGQIFSHFEKAPNGDARRAVFRNGETVEADLFLGCDGSQSRVRAQIFPQAEFSPTRVCELVSVVDSNLDVARTNRRFLKIRHDAGGLALGIVPASPQKLIWYLQFDTAKYPEPGKGPSQLRGFARSLTRGWSGPAEQLIRATDFNQTQVSPARVLEPLGAYFNKNVALVGDAAHALHSFTSQGVNTAIEDAALLAEKLAASRSSNHQSAFLDYSNIRKAAVRPLLAFGEKLQSEFLVPAARHPEIPLARTA
jgi:2-polyprenyl-6-methoxyphenol hydroxylase-like FAD-dependent oxidoreductase